MSAAWWPNFVASTTRSRRPCQCLAEQFFRPAVAAVGFRGVQQGDAAVDRRVHDGPGSGQVEPAAEVVAAEAGDRDGETRVAECPVAHMSAFTVAVVSRCLPLSAADQIVPIAPNRPERRSAAG